MICYYHKADLDGHCAGAIIKNKYPDCEMIGVDYSDRVEVAKIVGAAKKQKVFVVDFCFCSEDMHILNQFCELHWIDHHKTSIEWAYNAKFLAGGGQSLSENEFAGCERKSTKAAYNAKSSCYWYCQNF